MSEDLPARSAESTAERLLALHDELDRLTTSPPAGNVPTVVAVLTVMTVMGYVIFRLGIAPTVLIQFLLVGFVGAVIVGGTQTWRWMRIRALRREIREIEASADRPS